MNVRYLNVDTDNLVLEREQPDCPTSGTIVDLNGSLYVILYTSYSASEVTHRAVVEPYDAAPPKRAEKKDTNPKDAIGVTKAPLSFVPGVVFNALGYRFGCLEDVPVRPLYILGLVLFSGARKYGAHNWRVAGVRASIYYNALMRHVWQWQAGEKIDPESGLPHLGHAMACCSILLDAHHVHKLTDDRPPKVDALPAVDWDGEGSFAFAHLISSVTAWWEGGQMDYISTMLELLAELIEKDLGEMGSDWMAEMNDATKRIIETYPDPAKPHLEIDQ